MNNPAIATPDHCATPESATRRLLEFFELMPERPLPAIEALLRAGANPDVRGNSGSTPLHYAASNNDLDLVALLLRYEASINLPENYGNTPLHYACRGRGLETIRFLLNKGADPSKTNKSLDTPLLSAAHWPASHYDNEADKWLLPHPLTNIHHRNALGLTALDVAMKQQAIRTASRLAAAGAFVPEIYAVNFNIRNRLQEARKRWNHFCDATDRSATTIDDLHHFSNLGLLGDALHPNLWQGHEQALQTLFESLHPCHQRLALEQCPALLYSQSAAPTSQVQSSSATLPPKEVQHER